MSRLAPAAAIVIALAGCGRSSGKAEDRPAPGPTTAPIALAPTEAAAPALPADFPEAIPLYPGARVVVATRSETFGKPAWAATLETVDGLDAVGAFYKAGLGAFKRASGMRMADTDMSVWQGHEYDLTLMLTASADKTTVINLSVARK